MLEGILQAVRPVTGDGQGERTRRAGSAEGSEPPTRLSESTVFDLLRNARRRAVISFLLDRRGPATVREIAEHVAAAEYEIAAEELSPAEYKRVYTALTQCHFPRLDEYDVVEFDREANSVRPGPAAPEVERYLERGSSAGAARVEVAVATVVSVLVTLGILGVGPFGVVPVVSWTALTVVALVGLAILHLTA